MTEKTVPLEEPYDPSTAMFWGRFAAEANHQERHCPTLALYETTEGGEFFYVSGTRAGGKRDEGPLTKESTARTAPIPGTHATIFENPGEMLEWLDDVLAPLKNQAGA